jgi:hypothetical protein
MKIDFFYKWLLQPLNSPTHAYDHDFMLLQLSLKHEITPMGHVKALMGSKLFFIIIWE